MREEQQALAQRIEARQAEMDKTQHAIDNTQDKVHKRKWQMLADSQHSHGMMRGY